MLNIQQSQFIEKLRAEHPEVTPELIATTLRGEGWSEEDIAEVVQQFENPTLVSPATPPAPKRLTFGQMLWKVTKNFIIFALVFCLIGYGACVGLGILSAFIL